MNAQELNLLLYLETCAVDQAGRVDSRRVNDEEREIIRSWAGEGLLLGFGRISSDGVHRAGTQWVRLSDTAWAAAHAERRARAERLWQKRSWQSTDEKRAATETTTEEAR